MQWTTGDYIKGIYLDQKEQNKIEPKTKICAFDLDHTLIKPKNNKRFGDNNDPTDWEFYDKTVPNKLIKYIQDGYAIIIVTNQSGMTTGKTDIENWKAKINNFAEKLKRPFMILASLKHDSYRKPMTKMINDNVNYDPDTSIYIGDAGGLTKRRIGGIMLPKDFSDSDLKFALNLGIKFIHRDEFIFGKAGKPDKLTIDYPFNFADSDSMIKYIGNYKKFKPVNDKLDIIIMVGYPGSGKSYYVKNYIMSKYDNYEYINQDTLRTHTRCTKQCEVFMKDNKNVIIDNTNPSVEIRGTFINLAKKYNYKSIRCIYFQTSQEISMHNNYYRYILDETKGIVPHIAYNIYKKKFVEPVLTEGFTSIKQMEFKLDKNVKNEYFKYYY